MKKTIPALLGALSILIFANSWGCVQIWGVVVNNTASESFAFSIPWHQQVYCMAQDQQISGDIYPVQNYSSLYPGSIVGLNTNSESGLGASLMCGTDLVPESQVNKYGYFYNPILITSYVNTPYCTGGQ